ncbi:LpqB family beta-propeller domain-containing protein [Actinocorallia populi]|uniref:LpqB family beta-propeller domain-containing protein n=1 Tax=Actinocorallia populi TaxID=2079200 RepID=UPI000D089C95|nr:LpqB family beta-propeller domain-containing protein [Actinocorallia populi]
MKRIIAVLLALSCVTGCAGIPAGGWVTAQDNGERTEPFDEPYVRVVPTRPQDGWSPEEVVRGYLVAMANFDNDRESVRAYLAEGQTWRPDGRPKVTVLDDPEFSEPTLMSDPEEGDEATVRLYGTRLGQISSSGQYEALNEPNHEVTFLLRRITPNRWRLVGNPDELVLFRSDVDRVFRTTNLYHFAPDRQSLVPDSVFLPLLNRSDLPSQLVESLLSKTVPWLNGAVVSSFPEGTGLLGKVRLDEDVATVNLSKEAAAGNVDHMSAQLLWTLGQLTEIRAMRLQIDGRTRRTSDGLDVQEKKRWEDLGPDAPSKVTGESQYLLTETGQVALLQGSAAVSVPSLRDHTFRDAAVALNGQQFAGISGQALYVGDLSGGQVRRVLKAERGATLLRPSWDRSGNLWIVQNKGRSSTLWLLSPGRAEATRLPPLSELRPGQQIKALRVARDGVRVAALIGDGSQTEIQIGRIAPDDSSDDVYSLGFHSINAELGSVVDLAWRDADTLAVLGTVGASTSILPYEVPISGGAIRAIGGSFEGTPVSITAAPGKEILLGIAPGKESQASATCLQSFNEDPRFSTWDCGIVGFSPVYPG